ncbi:DUF4870 domain-containing protein [Knoellia koreensis]|uniref:DUF4870 domain-containing protein n=1 Tax=Knoellia koreensis TaxID=2730921 RepID=A0A849HE60_9MICO|nr:DUF4870 domain-containing protein [Knoellia sp. DB2414S]NNM44491.1 DUF4870 domain-containing protein [Knoellia sp. DB2414S]
MTDQPHQPQQPEQPNQPPQGQPYGQPYQQPQQISSEDRTMAILAHLSAIIAAVISVGWLSILGPLIVWAIYKDKSPLVRQAAAGAFNFNLAVWAAFIAGWICLFTIVLIPVAIILWVGAGIAALVCHIIGAVRASNGEAYNYPFQIKVLS